MVLFDIFVNILTHNLAEPAYEADVAQLEYKLVAGEHGLIIRVKGFNHKLPVSSNVLFFFKRLSPFYIGVRKSGQGAKHMPGWERLCVPWPCLHPPAPPGVSPVGPQA